MARGWRRAGGASRSVPSRSVPSVEKGGGRGQEGRGLPLGFVFPIYRFSFNLVVDTALGCVGTTMALLSVLTIDACFARISLHPTKNLGAGRGHRHDNVHGEGVRRTRRDGERCVPRLHRERHDGRAGPRRD